MWLPMKECSSSARSHLEIRYRIKTNVSRQIMAKTAVDLILVDVLYLGAFPLLLGSKNDRPPIVGCGVVPLLMTSADFGRRFPRPDKMQRDTSPCDSRSHNRRRFAGCCRFIASPRAR
jgi:hypothetical protein